jgi:hypothetical protein
LQVFIYNLIEHFFAVSAELNTESTPEQVVEGFVVDIPLDPVFDVFVKALFRGTFGLDTELPLVVWFGRYGFKDIKVNNNNNN